MSRLEADCTRCFGLCCVALPFARSADFPVDKAGGEPCRNLLADHRCGIHDRLASEGWRGCVTFDCFGAGQQVSQVTFGGVSWREAPGTAPTMYAVLPVMRQLHEMLVHLHDALALEPDDLTRSGLASAVEQVERARAGSPDEVLAVDLADLRTRVGGLLRSASATGSGCVTAYRSRPGACRQEPTSSRQTSARGTCARRTSGERCSSLRTCATPTCGGPTCSARTCVTRTCVGHASTAHSSSPVRSSPPRAPERRGAAETVRA